LSQFSSLDHPNLGPILGFGFGKNQDDIIDRNLYTNTNATANAKKSKKKPTNEEAEEPIVSKKNNNKSLGSYLIQQQFAGDFLEGII
jgi:hypothetical protein